ncbi:MAG: hypothetical protein AAF244_04405, partial [Pseudomonadota bacterium]
MSLCYKAVSGPRKPLSTSSPRERQIPTNARSLQDFQILELYESNLAFLIQALKDHRNSRTSYSFTNAIEHAPYALKCHPEDIYRAYDIQDTPYIYERNGTFSFWFMS